MAYIYVFSSPNGFVKIGRANTPRERFGMVQTGSPLPLVFEYQCECPDVRNVEAAIHRELWPLHQHLEWFILEPDHAISIVREIIAARFTISTVPHVRKKHGRVGRILPKVSEAAIANAADGTTPLPPVLRRPVAGL